MSAVMEADTVCETVLLEDLDFPIECGHSAHHMLTNSRYHDHGPAKFIMKALHNCKGYLDTVYPGCETWAKLVEARADEIWICPSCHRGELGKNMVFVVGPLDPS
jgi:hypothetical protein